MMADDRTEVALASGTSPVWAMPFVGFEESEIQEDEVEAWGR